MLAVIATPGSTEPLRALVRQLAAQVDIRSLDRIDGRPDGVLAASIDALDVAPPGLPVAVWVANAEELGCVPGLAEPHGDDLDVRVLLSSDRMAIGLGAVAVPAAALDTRSLPVLPPLVRARWRERHDLPAELVVTIEAEADPAGGAMTALALAAAAVVSGPMLASALALGTPVVSTPAEVDRLGLRPGHEVEVAERDASPARTALAGAIASDDEWAARLSSAARRFAESTLDVGRISNVVLDRLGLAASDPGRPRPASRLDRRLAELATPPTARICARAAVAAECFAELDDRS